VNKNRIADFGTSDALDALGRTGKAAALRTRYGIEPKAPP